MTNVTRITPEQIRETNRQIIYDYIYRHGQVSQQEISRALNMSRPTVASNLSAMEREGLIFRSGLIDGDMPGRKPATWSIASDYKIAIGVEIVKMGASIIAIDLYGHILDCVSFYEEYEDDGRYYEYISTRIKDFIRSLKVQDADKKILGIGFAIQGLVSEDGTTVTYGEILKCTGLKIDVFARRLDYHCRFIHEPDGAALSELWVSPELVNALYLSMSLHLGGALISDRKIRNGMHRHSSTFEHIQTKRDGELCYCGKFGCYETILSKEALLKGDDATDFFNRVRNSEPEALQRWREFLKYLAKLIAHLHLVLDTKYILGGHLAPFFTEEDIKILYHDIRERTPFIEEDDYILLSKMPSHNITVGAALPYITEFLSNAGKL